jgi:hypothetical protein
MTKKALNVIASEAKQSQALALDANGTFYKELNARLREIVSDGAQKIEL